MIAKKCREMIVDILNHSEMSIDTVYYMMKDIMNELTTLYEQYNQQQELAAQEASQKAIEGINDKLKEQGEDLEHQEVGTFLEVKEDAAAAQDETDLGSETSEPAVAANDEKKEE